MPLSLNLQFTDKSLKQNFLQKTIISLWIKTTIEFINKKDINTLLTVRFSTEEEACELNNAYRKKNYATNVLTFSYNLDETDCSADIVICPNIVKKEALEQNKALFAHYAHLVVHAVLHAFNFDHDEPQEEAIMQNAEIIILGKLGLNNPY